MQCPNCQQPSNRLIYESNIMACAACRGLSEAGGLRIDGTLTRNSFRVREQQRRFEADIITPHIYDKISKRMVPNPDFIKQHPTKIGNFFKQAELEQAGYMKIGHAFKFLDKQKRDQQDEPVIFKQ